MKLIIDKLFPLLVGMALLHSASAQERGTDDYLLVTDKEEDALIFINARTLEVEDRVAVGRGPHEVVVVPELGRAYVSNYEGDSEITFIDLNSRTVWQRIRLRRHEGPHGLAVSPGGKFLYITVEVNQGVLEMDPKNGEPLRTLQTGQRITHLLVMAPDGSRLYTSNLGSGNISVINRGSGEVIRHIATGNGTEGLALTPDGTELWVTNRARNTVSIINTQSLEVVDTLAVEGFPIRAAIAPDGRYAVISSAMAGTATIIDVSSRKILARLTTGEFPVGLLITPESDRAFVSNSRSGTVSVIDLQELEVIKTINVGGGPDGMAYVPAQ